MADVSPITGKAYMLKIEQLTYGKYRFESFGGRQYRSLIANMLVRRRKQLVDHIAQVGRLTLK